MRESIRGFMDATIEDVGEEGSATLAGDLSGVQALLVANDELRLVLCDPGLASHARRGVLGDLLNGRVSDASLALLDFVVEEDRATEIYDDIAWLAARSAAARDGLVAAGASPLGRTAAAECLDGYATRVLSGLDPERELGEVEDELFRFSRVVDGSDELRAALTEWGAPASSRRGLVQDLLASQASEVTIRLATYATEVGRARDYPELLTAALERVAEEADRRIAEVRAPVGLTEEQQRRVGAALGRIIGHRVDVRVIVDSRVLGGFVATIGDVVVDGSARHRLEMLRDRLVLPEANITT